MMQDFLQNGKAIYVLAAICLIGMISKFAARNLYKGLIRETDNMMTTRNRWLRQLRQRAEDLFRINQGRVNTQVFVEKQIYEARMGFFTPEGWQGFAGQMTTLCFFVGGGAAFLAYWYRCDSYYIVLYSSVGVLAGVFNLMLDYGIRLEELRQRLAVCIRDYLENSLWKRLGRDRLSVSDASEQAEEPGTSGRDRAGRYAAASRDAASRDASGRDEAGRNASGRDVTGRTAFGREVSDRTGSGGAEEVTRQRGDRQGGIKLLKNRPSGPHLLNPEETENLQDPNQTTRGKTPDSSRMSDEALNQLKLSLAQTAASAVSRSKLKAPKPESDATVGESWLRDLKPEEIQVLGEIIKEYLGE